jgi:BirA family biotin operon repressor/biotin-[acetyl-CoA-carboxylase] ligase
MSAPLTFSVLRLLGDGEFHSGEDMARALNTSRANVWHALKHTAQTGVTLFRVRGRGYCLADQIDWLSHDQVMRTPGVSKVFRLHILDTVDSTNDWVTREAQLGAKSGFVGAAEWQRRGRGRLGRAWHSALGSALTFSLLWRFREGAGSLSGLSLAVSVAVVRALARAGVRKIFLKWPNDILWQHRKLAGILIEISGDALGPTAVVIGIGINIKLGSRMKAEIDQAACDLADTGSTVTRSALLAYLLTELAEVLDSFSERGFAPFAAEWQRLHAYHEKNVTLKMPDGVYIEGKIKGAASDGSLMLKTHSGIRRFYGGEISLRPA